MTETERVTHTHTHTAMGNSWTANHFVLYDREGMEHSGAVTWKTHTTNNKQQQQQQHSQPLKVSPHFRLEPTHTSKLKLKALKKCSKSAMRDGHCTREFAKIASTCTKQNRTNAQAQTQTHKQTDTETHKCTNT